MINKSKLGSKIYSSIGWFCYITCSVISAVLNIQLLKNLDNSWAPFLIAMSLSLEFAKAFILIRANTYRSVKEYLGKCKFSSDNVKRKMLTFYGIYILFAILSITASLTFSLNITDKTEQGFAIQKQAIEQNISSLNESREKYSAALEKFTLLQENSDDEVKKTKEEMWAAEDAYNDAGNKLDAKANEIMVRDNLKLSQARNTVEYRNYRNTEIDYDGFKKKVERATDEYNSTISGLALQRAKNTYESVETEYNGKIALYGTLDELNLQLSELNKKEIAEAGSAKGFILLAQILGIPDKAKQVKFCILLFVSLLIELCIWLSSPDLRLDGNLLYSYRNDLQLKNEKEVKKLFAEIKNTNKSFSVEEEIIKEVKYSKAVDEKVKEIMEVIND